MHVLVVADGDAPERDALDLGWPGWSDGIELVVAADGGALAAERLGLRPDVIVGDGDSLPAGDLARFAATGVDIRLVPAEKDESDAELAMLLAVERGATRITIVGGLGGGRLDHSLANIGLLAHPVLDGRPACLLDGATRVRLIAAPDAGGAAVRQALPGPIGEIVTLLPFGDRVEGVTTAGLAYPLRDEPLLPGSARGLSNVRDATDASVTVRRGRLLIVEQAGTLAS